MGENTKEIIYRYPGISPFTTSDRELFFGRETDIENLFRKIIQNKTLLLYSKSGYGKSSLLNAGVIPKLNEDPTFIVIPIRFNPYNPAKFLSPVETISQSLRTNIPPGFLSILDKLLPADDSLWRHCKNLHLSKLAGKEKPPEYKLVLVLDQFEELFSYPPELISRFKEEFAAMLFTVIPQNFRVALEDRIRSDPDYVGTSVTENDLEDLSLQYNVKAVFSIRSDRMSYVYKISDYIQGIQQNFYELKALTRDQAKDAIENPARNPNPRFTSQPFVYEDDALTGMLDFLSKNNEVEAPQLQILCQHVETGLAIGAGKRTISRDDLGDIQKIFDEYYDEQIRRLPGDAGQTSARNLIEKGLIFGTGTEARRLSLFSGIITQDFNVSEQLLKQLVDQRILRCEPNAAGDLYYEISHDSLIAPILKARDMRLAEEKLAAEEVKRQKEFREAEEQRREEEERREAQRTLEIQKMKTEQQRRIKFILMGTFLIIMAVFIFWGMKVTNKNAQISTKNNDLTIQKFRIQAEKAKLGSQTIATEKQRMMAQLEAMSAKRARDTTAKLLAREKILRNQAKMSEMYAIHQKQIVTELKKEADSLFNKLSQKEAYDEYYGRGISNFVTGGYQPATQDFAIARFSNNYKDTGDVKIAKAIWANNMIRLSELGSKADLSYYEGNLDTADSLFTTIETKYRNIGPVGRTDPDASDSLRKPEQIDATQKRAVIKSVNQLWESKTGKVRDSVRQLDLSGQDLAVLPDMIGDLKYLEVVHLQNNRLTTIPLSIRDLDNLTEIDLSQNLLRKIPAGCLYLHKLKLINLDKNRITGIPPAIGNLGNITSLILSNNRIAAVPAEMGSLSSLVYLDLSHNELSEIRGWAGKLANLVFLDISSNKIIRIAPEFKAPSRLVSLYMSDNLVRQLPADLGNLEGLRTLIADSNHLVSLPPGIGKLSKLEILSLRKNHLRSVRPEIGDLDSLSILILCNNYLEEIPRETCRLLKLKMLDISDNIINSLPGEIGKLRQVRILDAGINKLSSLPPAIGLMTGLDSLNLRINQLASVPAELGNLKQLKLLDVSNNNLSNLPGEIGSLTSLAIFRAGFNELRELPAEFYDLKHLSVLDLHQNLLRTLPNIVSHLESLSSLDLSYNRIDMLPRGFGSLNSLKVLDLSGNQISRLLGQVSKLTSLTFLDISNTGTTDLAGIGKLSELKHVDLSGNPIQNNLKDLWNIRKLTYADLSNCNLNALTREKGLTREIGRVTALTFLDLSNNGLTYLPSEIWDLINLTRLDLSGNNLDHLESEFSHLQKLERLDLSGNRLTDAQVRAIRERLPRCRVTWNR